MKKLLFTTFSFILGGTLLIAAPAGADDGEKLSRVGRAEEKVEKEGVQSSGLFGRLSDYVTFSGTVELDYSYTDPRDITDAQSDSTSNIDVGEVELGANVKFHEWVTGNFVLKGENLDNDDRVFWDEAAITVQKDGFPLYFTGGKRGQPFGVFNSHLVTDPITQDCYEVVKTGATAGFTPSLLGLDISVTAYKGEILADKVSEAGYGWTRDPYPNPDPTDDVTSYIFNVSMEPLTGLKLSFYYDSEPGQDRRNKTAGGTVEYRRGAFTFDAEYIGALERETNMTTVKKHKESAWFAGVAVQVLEPLELAVRYEGFSDGMDGNQSGHLNNRYSLGANYKLFEKENFVATLMLEYRRSNYEKAAGAAHNGMNEAFAKLAFEF